MPQPVDGVFRPLDNPKPDLLFFFRSSMLRINQTLVFGNYRRASLFENTAITFATVSPIAWKAVRMFRNMKRTWAKATVAIASPCIAWLARTVAAYVYK